MSVATQRLETATAVIDFRINNEYRSADWQSIRKCNRKEPMPRIQVTTRTGETREFSVAPSGVLMESLRDANIDGIEGLCGGCCSCATCHVHVDPAMAARLPPPGADENMLLSGLLSYSPNSRLACQIPVTEALDGLRLTIPSES